MKNRNFGQAKRQKEASRKARQQEKLDRKHARATKPSEAEPASTDAVSPETASSETSAADRGPNP